jgi:hypothetical protein
MLRATRTPRQELIRAARQGQDVPRVEVPVTPCGRCGRPARLGPEGEQMAHLRPTMPEEPGHSDIVPTMTACEGVLDG